LKTNYFQYRFTFSRDLENNVNLSDLFHEFENSSVSMKLFNITECDFCQPRQCNSRILFDRIPAKEIKHLLIHFETIQWKLY